MVNVSNIPHMDPETLEVFTTLISASNIYLEYGSGGSTIHALQKNQQVSVYSVESDAIFAQAVKQNLSRSERKRLHIEQVDIGPTGDWGVPVDDSGWQNYWKYCSSVWTKLSLDDASPDLILIDGRFRVACFIYSLIYAKPGTVIVLDDYADREGYHVVEQFISPKDFHGRAALFVVDSDIETASLLPLLLENITKPIN